MIEIRIFDDCVISIVEKLVFNIHLFIKAIKLIKSVQKVPEFVENNES